MFERLAVIETKLDALILGFENHLMHHWAIEVVLVTVIGGLFARWMYKAITGNGKGRQGRN